MNLLECLVNRGGILMKHDQDMNASLFFFFFFFVRLLTFLGESEAEGERATERKFNVQL